MNQQYWMPKQDQVTLFLMFILLKGALLDIANDSKWGETGSGPAASWI